MLERAPQLNVINIAALIFVITPLVFGADITQASQASALAEGDSSDWLMISLILVAGLAMIAFYWLRADELKLISKVTGLVAIMLVLISFLATFAITSMNNIGAELKSIAEDDIPISNAIASITAHQLEQALWLERGAVAGNLASTNENRLAQSIREFQSYADQVDEELKHASDIARSSLQHARTPQEKAEFEMAIAAIRRIEKEHEAFNTLGNEVLLLAKQGQSQEASLKLEQVEEQEDQLDKELQELNREIADFTQKAALTAEAHEEAALSSLLFISFESFILSIILATIILNSLRRQLGADPKELMEVAREIANGNLDIPKKAKVTGVYDSLITTVERLKDIIVGIKMGSEEVSVATEQVSKGNMDLSQRTQEQASSLEEVAASMEEMTGAVGQNASNAGRARDLASAARDQADKGSEVVNRAIASMGEINESSKRISEIIGVIDEIAFQTNLLALNAAVEAARAGDQGRGFGVVAGEVRTLAGRSAEAAKEIKALIEDSVAKVRDGTEFVGQSGEVLSDILTSVKEVSEVVNEIAAANSEQSGGIQQVNTAIMQMDEMTQQNASLVEEAAAASETMGAQAQELQASIAFFRLSQEDEEAIRRAAKTNGVATRSRRLN